MNYAPTHQNQNEGPANRSGPLLTNAASCIEEMVEADKRGPLVIECGRGEMFCVIAAVQLACRHPGYTGPSREITEAVIRQIAERFPPGARAMIEKGWNPEHDEMVGAA